MKWPLISQDDELALILKSALGQLTEPLTVTFELRFHVVVPSQGPVVVAPPEPVGVTQA